MIRHFPHKLDQNGIAHRFMSVGIAFIVIFSFFMTIRSVASHAVAIDLSIHSGVNGYCLDDHNNNAAQDAIVDSWGCNISEAQNWHVNPTSITHANGQCVSVYKNGTAAGESIVLDTCSLQPGQVWLRDNAGFYNPNSGLCLSLPSEGTNHPLILDSCTKIAQPFELWHVSAPSSCNDLSEGSSIACNAVKQWTIWQSGTPDHTTLLNTYTDGAPYEEWCADFVSYVFHEAGYPFRHGETDGWDENLANNVQYQGFTYHQAGTYIPKTGDVAYFDYQGGHVEIVVSGGNKPTYVYGNSATIDPSTGNGEMRANTISSDGVEGSVQYYLSPQR